MRVGILSDIHGNSVALRNTLDEARRLNVERLIVLGDLIGYYYDAKGVMALLRDWKVDAIRGNHERYLEASLTSASAAMAYRSKYGSSLDLARETLLKEDLSWLLSLPDQCTVTIDGVIFELCHGSPQDKDEYVYPNASTERLAGVDLQGRDFVLMGHTHYPFMSLQKNSVLLNPGSVGQPRDLGGLASWCWLDCATQAIAFVRTPFDTSILIREAQIRDPGLPYLSEIQSRGVSAQQNR